VCAELVDFQNELQRLVSSNPATQNKVFFCMTIFVVFHERQQQQIALVSTPPQFDAASLLHIARVLEQPN
jgi:hypothetical protein